MTLQEWLRYAVILSAFLAGFVIGRDYEHQMLIPPDISGSYAGPRMANAQHEVGCLNP